MLNRLKMGSSVLLAGLAATLLSACSGEPSGNDMKQAIRNNGAFMMQMRALAQMSGGGTNIDQMLDGADLEKGGCSEANGSPGFVCDFRLNANGQAGQWGKARFFNADGWQMEQIQ